jgi:hypothetical protein
MSHNRARLRIEQFEDRVNPVSVNIGSGSGVFTFNIAGYNIVQNNANSATTSSAFGFSEASMTQSQTVDTLNGGTDTTTLNDAFDGYFSFGLTNAGIESQTTYVDADGIVDITPAPTNGGTSTTTAGTILTGDFNTVGSDGNSFNGLELAQQNAVFALNSQTPIIRSLFMVRNPTSSTITQQVGIFNNLGSDSNTALFSTSSGDATFTAGMDRWAVSFQNFSGTTSSDTRILTVVQGPGTVDVSLANNSNFVNGDDNPLFAYNLSVAPGETQYILAFVGLHASRAAANTTGQNIFNSNTTVQNAGLLAGLSTTILDNVVNWNFVPPVVSPPISPPAVVPNNNILVATAGGVPAQVSMLNASGTTISSIFPFGDFVGAINVATGDVNNDGIADTVVATANESSHVKVFSGANGSELFSFLAFEGFQNGVSVAVGDLNGDGFAEIIVGAGNGGFSHVKAFSGSDLTLLRSFFAYTAYASGVNVAAADVDNDGMADIITATAAANSHVKVFSGANNAEDRSFIAFNGFTGGINVAAGDLNGDGFAEIVVGATNVPHVKAFDGSSTAELLSFLAFDGFSGGVSVGVANDKVVVGTLGGASTTLKTFTGTGQQVLSLFPFDPTFTGGIFVGGEARKILAST